MSEIRYTVKVWEDFSSFALLSSPIEIEGVEKVINSLVGGWLLVTSTSNICLPKTVILDIIKQEET